VRAEAFGQDRMSEADESGTIFGGGGGGDDGAANAEEGGATIFGGSGSGEGADERPGDSAQFTPKVKVEEVEVRTMEEDEVVCFKRRGKLFVFVTEDVYGGEVRKNWWRERGTGDVKLLRHKEMGKVRLLMRQEKTLKICANHLVSPHVELKPNVGSDRSWLFTAADFAEEELKTETFALKFANAENANLFKEKLELAKKINAGEVPPETMEEMKEDEDAPTGSPVPSAPGTDEKKQQSSSGSAQQEAPKQTAGDPSPGLSQGLAKVGLGGIPGGYNSADPSSDEVQEAAKFAVETLGKGDLLKIVEAAQQVVAGMNFHLNLHIEHSDSGEIHSYTVKVFKPLPHENKPLQMTESSHNGRVE